MKKVSTLLVISAALLGAAGADTMSAFVEHGVTVEQGGVTHETEFEDGRFTRSDGAAGTYEFSDNSLCMMADGSDQKRCFELPEGKASGDSFTIALPNGQQLAVTIN